MDAFRGACEGRRTDTIRTSAESCCDRAGGNPRRSDFVCSLTTLCRWSIARIALQTESCRRPTYFAYSFRWLTSWACKRRGRTSGPLCQGDGIVSHRVLRKTPLGLLYVWCRAVGELGVAHQRPGVRRWPLSFLHPTMLHHNLHVRPSTSGERRFEVVQWSHHCGPCAAHRCQRLRYQES